MQELPFVPVIYLMKLVEVMEEEHLCTDYILRECGINRSLLEKPEVYLSVHQSRAVIQRYLGLTTQTQPGLRYGMRLDLLTHGLFGYVFLFRGHFRELMNHVTSYMQVRLPLVKIDIRHETDYFAIVIDFPIKLPEVESFVIEAFLGSFYKLGSMVTHDISLHVRDGVFRDSRGLQSLLPVPLTHGHDCNEIRFHVTETAVAKESGESPRKTTEAEVLDLPGIVVRLRQFVLANVGAALAAEEAAEHLGMSERTLRRKLAEGGYTYQQIRLDVRMNASLRYLQTSGISIERIAGMVGYSDQATFSRAFMKWHGETPDSARRKTVKQYLKKGQTPETD